MVNANKRNRIDHLRKTEQLVGEDTVTALKKSVLKKNNDLFKYKIITKNRYVRLQQLVDLDLEH